MSSTPQGSFGSQPECWEEPGGIMDSIVGIIPRSAPPRATSFSGLLAIPDDDNAYNNSGPPTPYDNTNDSSQNDDDNNTSLPSMLPTFSFLKLDVEAEKRRNINLSKLWDINPLVSLPPPTASSTDLTNGGAISLNGNENNNNNNNNNYNNNSIANDTTTSTTTTTTRGNNSITSAGSFTEPETDENDKEDDENELLSPHSSPPVKGHSTSTSPKEKRKRGPYNTRNRIAAAAQAKGQNQEQFPDDDIITGIQPRSKRKRLSTTDVEVPTSEPDLATPAPPPSRKARGAATTTARRGRGARNIPVTSPSSPPPSSSPSSPPSSAPIIPETSPITPTKPTYTNVTGPIVPTATTRTTAGNRTLTSPDPDVTIGQIKSLETKLDTHERNVDDLRTQQSAQLIRSDCDLKELLRVHERTSASVRATHGDADALIRGIVLEPAQIARVRTIRENLSALLVRLRVLWREASLYAGTASSSSDACHGALIIREQAPPRVIFKGKENKDMGKMCVELVTPTKIRCEILTPVAVSLCSTSAQKKDITNIKALASSTPFVGCTQDVDNNMMAIFEQLKLTTSTRMICSNLRFQLSMKTTGPSEKGKLVEIESEASYPFIAITNESQWPEAAGKLLYSDAFDGDKIETSWAYYANTLQLHFMTITNQTLENPARKFYPWELRYIHSRFGSRTMLSKDATEKFWGFFGPVLLNIHFKRKIYEMWRDGLIYGLISKEECSAVLSKQKEGTFLIRFSESIPGAFAIAYVNTDSANEKEKVRHYLVKSDDLGSNKTLPDYLKEKNQFTTILKLDPASKALEAIPKDEALELLYSKRGNTDRKPPEGYIGFL